MDGYSQDPGFDQNMVQESAKLQISWRVRDLTAPQEAGLTKIWAWDEGFFTCLLGIREIVMIQIKVHTAKATGVAFQIKQQSMHG